MSPTIYYSYKDHRRRFDIFCWLIVILISPLCTADNHLLRKTCTGTSTGLSSSPNDYAKLKNKFTGCVYVNGNVEISNFNPLATKLDRRRNSEHEYSQQQLSSLDENYDFSFLDDIKEISGYILIHGTMIKNIKFKSLEIVRGQNLFHKYSIYIDHNVRLERLDLTRLKEIENGSVYIRDNSKLCHMNEVNWRDLFNDEVSLSGNKIDSNADPKTCKKCTPGCEWTPRKPNEPAPPSGCWFIGGCQNLTRVICHPDCEGRCYGPGSKECCNPLCSAGCTGSSNGQCNVCKKYQDVHNQKCVDNCERLFSLDSKNQDQIVKQEEGRYYLHNLFCVKECPSSYFKYDQYCLKHCPNMTYEFEKEEFDPAKKKVVTTRVCKSCESDRKNCQKTCALNEQINKENLKTLHGCEILKGDLVVMPDKEGKIDITEHDLKVLKTLKTINGYVRIQYDNISSLSFLGNLETIRPKDTLGNKYGLLVWSNSLKTIGLNKLRSIESGIAVFNTNSLCLHDQINWLAITHTNETSIIKTDPKTNCDGYKCDDACTGCWGNGPKSCQFCKTFKIEDRCVERCDQGYKLDGKFLYVSDPVRHLCDYCHPECKSGCTGPTSFDCVSCQNKFLRWNDTTRECLSTCKKAYYPNSTGECLPCSADCDSCQGPENKLSPNGCVTCSSALVKNDDAFTIIKCINQATYNCTHDMFWETVKINHPLQSKQVCRLCHDECDGCKDNGNILGKQCLKCKNYYSKATNKCVSACSENEYLNQTTRQCLPCHDQCMGGCRGGEQFECTDCKNKKLRLQDFKQLILKRPITISGGLDQVLSSYSSKSPAEDENVNFCFEQCPDEMKYENNGVCSSEANRTKRLHIIIMVLTVLGAFAIIAAGVFLYMKKSGGRKPNIPFNNKERVLHLVNADKLKMGNVLGKGAFGTVYEGYYMLEDEDSSKPKKIKVAIKVLSRGKSADEKVAAELSNELINEAQVMAKVDHPHCLCLLGICVAEPMMLISELMEFGSVASFLSNHDNLSKIEEKTLLIWAKQIAEGMEYLQSLGIVHRDLAARNILIKTIDHVKITDFGLAKLLESQKEGYTAQHNTMVPIKWLAIESIDDRLFTHESDVWSYGVCIWEIFTFCAKPFSEVDPHDLKTYLYKGVRLAQPRLCQMEIYFIMVKCWLENRKARPSFKSLKEDFEKMSLEPFQYLNSITTIDLNKDFKTINEDSKVILEQLNKNVEPEDDKSAEISKASSSSRTLTRTSIKKSEIIELERLRENSWSNGDDVPKYIASNGSENKTFYRSNFYNTQPKANTKVQKMLEPFSKFKHIFSRKITSQISTNSGTRLLSSVSTDSTGSNRSPIDLTTAMLFHSVSGSSSSSSSSSASSTASSGAYEPTGDKALSTSPPSYQTAAQNDDKFIVNPMYMSKSDNTSNLSRHNSNRTQKLKYSKYNRESSITNTNSDYLEPIINHANIRQNQEYFGNYVAADNNEEVNLIAFAESPTQNSVIIMPDHYGQSFSANDNSKRQNVRDIYYNDEASRALMPTC